MAEFDIPVGVGLDVTKTVVAIRVDDGRCTTEVGLRVEIPDGDVSYHFGEESFTDPTTGIVVDSLTRAVEGTPEEVLRERLDLGPRSDRIDGSREKIIKGANRRSRINMAGGYIFGAFSGGGGVYAAMNFAEHHNRYVAVGLVCMSVGAIAFSAIRRDYGDVVD